MSTAALMQLGRVEFARICDGKAPSLDSVLGLAQFVMGKLKVEGLPVSDLAERTVDVVGEILRVIAESSECTEELKSFAKQYATDYAPILRATISGTEAITAAFSVDASVPGAAPRWKTILMAVIGMLQMCMSSKAAAAVIPSSVVAVVKSPETAIADAVETAQGVVADAVETAQIAVADAVETAQGVVADAVETAQGVVPSAEELAHDIRLIVDAKAPPAPHAPTPPPTPDQIQESAAE